MFVNNWTCFSPSDARERARKRGSKSDSRGINNKWPCVVLGSAALAEFCSRLRRARLMFVEFTRP